MILGHVVASHVFFVALADVTHCAEVCEWFLRIRMERRRARRAVGEEGWQVILHVTRLTDWARFWPHHALHVMCSSIPKWCTREALIATEWVVFWTWSLGPFWCTSMPSVWPVPKSWKVGCAMFSSFRLHVLEIPQAWKCRVLVFVHVFFLHICETQSSGSNDVTTFTANWTGPASVPLQLAIFVSFFTVLRWHRLSSLGRNNGKHTSCSCWFFWLSVFGKMMQFDSHI